MAAPPDSPDARGLPASPARKHSPHDSDLTPPPLAQEGISVSDALSGWKPTRPKPFPRPFEEHDALEEREPSSEPDPAQPLATQPLVRWRQVVALITLVALGALSALAQAESPYLQITPGPAPNIGEYVEGTPSDPSSDSARVRLTTIEVANLSWGRWAFNRLTGEGDSARPAGSAPSDTAREALEMSSSKLVARGLAQAAVLDGVEPARALLALSVAPSSPLGASGVRPGDPITAFALSAPGTSRTPLRQINSLSEFTELVSAAPVGARLRLRVLEGGSQALANAPTAAELPPNQPRPSTAEFLPPTSSPPSPAESSSREHELVLDLAPGDPARLGAEFVEVFDLRGLSPRLAISTEGIAGPSAGLAFALFYTEALSSGALTSTHDVAATGTIDAQGRVGEIAGIELKVAGAHKAGASVFFVPAAQAALARAHASPELTVVPVETFQEAVGWLCANGGDSPVCEPLPVVG